MMRFLLFLLSAAVFSLGSQTAWAQLQDENLIQNVPQGYKVAFQTRKGNMIITEMVPEGESANNWSEMVTTQIFLGQKNTTPQRFRDLLKKQWASACKGSGFASVAEGRENGYAFAVWLQDCPLNQATGKPEKTWLKAIQGNDSFYVVQKAFKFNPSEEQVVKWSRYLRSVQVCDTRLPDRPCPKFEKVNRQAGP